ncbi:MFS transporter [Clostridium intestinale]|uniref:MFS transporter n=1 Tax=Clostridium intestinale TaxID=36845 RepID=UPI002DD639AE|nr:MFS transporter [Clostridium intestinale]WRY50751.1 MFS transporter [Clostridium intestinale]
MNKKKTLALILFLLGIFIGAMDTGIVSPARTVIANSFGIDASSSIWMITIYTLAYAVTMPISGKLSDIYGKKKIYTISILIFGLGSLLCGISDFYGGFTLLLVARVIQAIGGGGIMPIATAYIGETFPPEKRGSALGMVGAIYGIATTLGPTIGSGLLSLVGNDNWGFLFFINVPIVVVILILSKLTTDESSKNPDSKLDTKGSIVVSALILSLMYALTNLNFHDFINSIKSITVYPFLIIFVLLVPVFIYVEKRAENPVINLKYFKDRNITLTLIISFIVGSGLMGIVFVPQFGENILKLKTGSGGYLVTLMAIFSGVSAPLGGKLIDKYSAKFILIIGFISTIIGTLTLSLITAKTNSPITLFIGLAFIGIGMGFYMGTPLNYLMQSYVPKNETSSAQATLSLIRSIGVAISPNILINFIADAGKNMAPELMKVLPQPEGMPVSALSGGGMTSDTLSSLQNADVTTIFDAIKNFALSMIDKVSPMIKASLANTLPPNVSSDSIIEGIKASYLSSLDANRATIESTFQSVLNGGFAKLFIGAAVIAGVGLLFTLMLSTNKTKSEI